MELLKKFIDYINKANYESPAGFRYFAQVNI